jgi:hypothetical protein
MTSEELIKSRGQALCKRSSIVLSNDLWTRPEMSIPESQHINGKPTQLIRNSSNLRWLKTDPHPSFSHQVSGDAGRHNG